MKKETYVSSLASLPLVGPKPYNVWVMAERFVSEPIKPVIATCDPSSMAFGGPGVPREFLWRGQIIKILAVVRTWRQSGRCHHGSPELYIRRHWFEVATAFHGTMKIYFDRQPHSKRKGERWWLFSTDES